MHGLIVTLLTLTTATSYNFKEPSTYDEIFAEAIHDCKNRKFSDIDRNVIQRLIAIEKKHNVPPSLRGMLLAAACSESGYRPDALGDHKFSKKRKPKAVGMFQMWKWWERAYKIDRRNPYQSADAWLKHIKKQIKSVRRECKFKSKKRIWLAAWVKAMRAPKRQGNRCYEKVKHYRILKRWRKNIINARKMREGC